MCIFNICKDVLGRLPKVVGVDIVEMALWAKVWKFSYVVKLVAFFSFVSILLMLFICVGTL